DSLILQGAHAVRLSCRVRQWVFYCIDVFLSELMDFTDRARLQSLSKSNDPLMLVVKDSTALATAVDQLESLLPPNRWRRHFWQAVNALSFVVFVASAILQLNDPDPYLWIPIYALPCLLALVLGIFPKLLATRSMTAVISIHLCICLIMLGFIGYAPLVTRWQRNAASDPLALLMSAEEASESIGLLLVIAWLSGHLMLLDLLTRLSKFFVSCCISVCIICFLMLACVPPVAMSLAALLSVA
uniref:Transmembrane protein n=1 Tax=Macrostomum lignano TaxID=282301 RepID=A0A1I8G3W0_9PLAT